MKKIQTRIFLCSRMATECMVVSDKKQNYLQLNSFLKTELLAQGTECSVSYLSVREFCWRLRSASIQESQEFTCNPSPDQTGSLPPSPLSCSPLSQAAFCLGCVFGMGGWGEEEQAGLALLLIYPRRCAWVGASLRASPWTSCSLSVF